MRNTSPLNISFSLAEKLAVLSKAGYVTKEVVVQMSWNVYHDDIEVEDRKVLGVFDKDGKEVDHPTLRDFGHEDWVDAVFYKVVKARVLNLLLV